MKNICLFLFLSVFCLAGGPAFASEADLVLPDLSYSFELFGQTMTGKGLLSIGMIVCFAGMAFGISEYIRIKKLPVHKAMEDVSILIHKTCDTYLFQQIKLLCLLEIIIGACLFYYFYVVFVGNCRFRMRCLVRHYHQQLRQLPYGICGFARQTGRSNGIAAAFRHVNRRFADLCRIGFNAGYSVIRFPGRRRFLFYRFCDRRIAGRFRVTYLRRYFHKNCRHRFGFNENLFQY